MAHDIDMVWVAGGTDHIPQPTGTRAGTGVQLGVPLLCTIDIEHGITVRVGIDGFLSLVFSHHGIMTVLLSEVLTTGKSEHVSLRARLIVVCIVKFKRRVHVVGNIDMFACS